MSLVFYRVFLVLAALTISPSALASSISLLPGGQLNEIAIDAMHHTIDVQPGATIAGTLRISVTKTAPVTNVFPVGTTATWGTREAQAREIRANVGVGTTEIDVGIGLLAPDAPGLYHIVFAASSECKYFHVLSATNWATASSPITCGSVESSPIWNDGNDIGWDWTPEQFEQAQTEGQVTQLTFRPLTDDYAETTYAATWVGLRVVPEPGTATVLGIGLATLAARQRFAA